MKTKKHKIRDARRAWWILQQLSTMAQKWPDKDRVARAFEFIKYDLTATAFLEVAVQKGLSTAASFKKLNRIAASKYEMAETLGAMIYLRSWIRGKNNESCFRREEGICRNIHEIFGQFNVEQLMRCCTAWPKYSKNFMYPVPGGITAYIKCEDMYSGKYGELRYEMLSFCINRYTEQVLEY